MQPFLTLPADTGPIYRETLMGRLPVEPWNTFSNLIFLGVVLYWAWKVYPTFREHLFLAIALPVLLIGYVGGTLYHGLRDQEIWLWMDWLPIVLLCLASSILFARRGGLAWMRVVPLLLLPFFLRYIMTDWIGWSTSVVLNVEYAVIASAVLAPLLLHLYVRRWRSLPRVLLAVAFFGTALLFRVLDHHSSMAWASMGTHWLWHLFGGVAVHFLIGYIYQDDEWLKAEHGVREADQPHAGSRGSIGQLRPQRGRPSADPGISL